MTKNNHGVFKTLGASNHTKENRHKEDYYATEPKATELLLEEEKFSKDIWECACGEGHIAKVLKHHGYNVRSTDLINRGYGEQKDFLFFNTDSWDGDIITNPPYSLAQEFILKSLELINDGSKVAMLLRLSFLEGKARKVLFRNFPPKIVYVSSGRLLCAKNGDFEKMIKDGGSAIAYAWYVWQKGFTGETKIRWIN